MTDKGASMTEPVALFTQTDYDAERWTALMLLWGLGEVTLTTDDAGMFVVDFDSAESADRTWKGKGPEECLAEVIESFTSEHWDFDALPSQWAAATAVASRESGPVPRHLSHTHSRLRFPDIPHIAAAHPAPAPASLRDMTEADFDKAHGIAPAKRDPMAAWGVAETKWAKPMSLDEPADVPNGMWRESAGVVGVGALAAGVPDVDGFVKKLSDWYEARYPLDVFLGEPAHPNTVLLKEVADALAALQGQLATLATNKDAVRVNLLRGTLARPDDLFFMHDTNGPYAQQAKRITELKAKLAEAATLIDHLGGSSKFIREVMG